MTEKSNTIRLSYKHTYIENIARNIKEHRKEKVTKLTG